MNPQLIRRKITLAEYHKMIEVGILHEDEHVELIRGEIIHMSPKGRKHSACVSRTLEALEVLGKQVIVRSQDPIQLSNDSEPEPDIAVVKRKDDFYESGHPTPDDVWIIIEVADSSLKVDRSEKIPLYAFDNIPEYWIVNIPDKQIEVYQDPVRDQYDSVTVYPVGTEVPLPITDHKVQVSDIFG